MFSHTVQSELGTSGLLSSVAISFLTTFSGQLICRGYYGSFLISAYYSSLQTDNLNVKSYLTRFCPSNSQVLDGSTPWLPVAFKQNNKNKKVKLQSIHTSEKGVTAAEEVQSAAPGIYVTCSQKKE